MQRPQKIDDGPWVGYEYLGMIGLGVLLGMLIAVLPAQPHPALSLTAMFGAAVAVGLVIRAGIRFSLAAEEQGGRLLALRQFLRELAVALALFVLYLGLLAAQVYAGIYAG